MPLETKVVAKCKSGWHEDDGPVLWWKFPIAEPPYIGTPLDQDWPGYHTHYTPHPPVPVEPDPWWKNTYPWQLMDCRQSGYHFFEDGPLSRRIAAYPGSTNEQEARDHFARDNPSHVLPF